MANTFNLKVTSVRYFETNRGVGYQCKTNMDDVEILNDGNGGGTYVSPPHVEKQIRQSVNMVNNDWFNMEIYLEEKIDEYENPKDYMCNNCGGGFCKEEMSFDDSNDHDVCTACFVATEQYKDEEFADIDNRMAKASGWDIGKK